MKRPQISNRERWLISAAAATAMVFVLMKYWILPYWDSVQEIPDNIAITSKRVLNYRKLLLGQSTVQAALETARRETAILESRLLTSKTDALAVAEIQGVVKEIVTSKGMTLRRSDLLPVKVVSPEYARVSTRIETTGGIDQIVNLLLGFEASPKALFAEEVRITPVQFGNLRNKQVLVSMTVSALKFVEAGNSVQPEKG
jgi:hypothetical protein